MVSGNYCLQISLLIVLSHVTFFTFNWIRMQLLKIVIYAVCAMLHFVYQLFGFVRLVECTHQRFQFNVMPDDGMECLEGRDEEVRRTTYVLYKRARTRLPQKPSLMSPCGHIKDPPQINEPDLCQQKSTRDSNIPFF